MKLERNNTGILSPKRQLNLYGYESYFNSFTKLHKKNKLPNVMLFSGQKGIGKSTFAYHLINFLLSDGEKDKYSDDKFEINPDNSSFKLIQSNIHPNFFLLDNAPDEESIKIDKIRNLLKFLNKTTYSKELKLVFLDNAEYLNLNSSNALLKSLEETQINTYFIIIHNSSSFISETVKSRCVEFKFTFNTTEKKGIFKNILKHYPINSDLNNLDYFFTYESPGNLIRYLTYLNDEKIDLSEIDLSTISFLIEKYKNQKDSELLNFTTLLIEKFYNNLSLKNIDNVTKYNFNKDKILHLIHNMKVFNLDKKNMLTTINKILKNER